TKQDVPARVYPYGEAAAHLTGYVGEITAEEWEELKEEGYRKDDVLGKSGLEQVFEERLRGEDGGVITIESEAGEEKEVIAEKEPRHGEDIQLTVDMVLQESLYNEMKGDAGTAVALHPKTGEVLALVNSPAYDPNAFVLGLSGEQWEEWEGDPKKPLLNRFAQLFAPGSAFKPVTAAIGLETGAIQPEGKRNITGKAWQADASWGNYTVRRVTDPGKPVNLRDAFVYSDNIYFAQTALDIGEEAFLEGAKGFGIGEKIPFAYPVKASQLAGEDGIQSEVQLADTGYGQGQVLMSALHLALTYTPLVNGGNMLAPQLEKSEGKPAQEVWKEQVISEETAELILSDLIDVVEHPKGTGREAKISGVTIAGKTGTAELKESQDDETGTENGWFVAVDTDDPSLLIAMMVEDVKDRGGSHYVVPKVKKVMGDFLRSD
ncbi:MAG: penicillin-binding protein 2, partial [Novibacillus thermophilus]